MSVHLHRPPATERLIQWATCPDCRRYSALAGLAYEWYAAHWTCMRCGRSFSDGERLALPFMRGARQAEKDAKRAAWKRAAPAEIRVIRHAR